MRIVAMLAVAVAAVTLSLEAASGRGAPAVKEGGIFRVAVPAGQFDAIDPALHFTPASDELLRPACGALMAYPAKPPPEGLRPRPELAEAEPVVSKDGRTHIWTIRKDARFSTGQRVTARDFVRALERVLDPAMRSPLAVFVRDIVGAEDMKAGRTTTLAGAVAQGRTLILRHTTRVSDYLVRVTRWCAVPASLPADPEGAKAPLPSAGPYFVAEYVPGERLVLERNRFYGGQRPQRVARITADLAADAGLLVEDIASGKVEWGFVPSSVLAERGAELARRYGVNRSQFFVTPGTFLRMFHLNVSRPLFRNNVKLRQAINFAVDRRALTRELGPFAGTPTDQYLLPTTAGFRDERIYPLRGPDLRKARALARGRTREGKAVLYTRSEPAEVAHAQVLQQNLKAIGLEVEIVQFPGRLVLEKLATPGEPFDIGRIAWGQIDPFFLDVLFHGRTIGLPGSLNWSYFNSARYNRLLDAAARLSGDERYRAYGELDVTLSRDAAPAIPVAILNQLTFVSARVGCIVLNPTLDLTAVCLK